MAKLTKEEIESKKIAILLSDKKTDTTNCAIILGGVMHILKVAFLEANGYKIMTVKEIGGGE